MPDLVSRPFNPDPAKCCERCVFGTGGHSDWCLQRGPTLLDVLLRQTVQEVFGTPDLPLTEEQLDRWVEQWVEP